MVELDRVAVGAVDGIRLVLEQGSGGARVVIELNRIGDRGRV